MKCIYYVLPLLCLHTAIVLCSDSAPAVLKEDTAATAPDSETQEKRLLIKNEVLKATYKILAEQLVLSLHMNKDAYGTVRCEERRRNDQILIVIKPTDERYFTHLGARIRQGMDNKEFLYLAVERLPEVLSLPSIVHAIEGVLLSQKVDMEHAKYECDPEKGRIKLNLPFKKNN